MKTFVIAEVKNERLLVNNCEIDSAEGEQDSEGEIDIDVDYVLHAAEYDRRIRQEPLNPAEVELKSCIYKRVDGSEVDILNCLTQKQIWDIQDAVFK